MGVGYHVSIEVAFNADTWAQDRFGSIPLKKGGSNRVYWRGRQRTKRLCWPLRGLEGLHRDQLGHLAKVLGGGREGELVARAVWAS
jgi:hypothetical protein